MRNLSVIVVMLVAVLLSACSSEEKSEMDIFLSDENQKVLVVTLDKPVALVYQSVWDNEIPADIQIKHFPAQDENGNDLWSYNVWLPSSFLGIVSYNWCHSASRFSVQIRRDRGKPVGWDHMTDPKMYAYIFSYKGHYLCVTLDVQQMFITKVDDEARLEKQRSRAETINAPSFTEEKRVEWYIKIDHSLEADALQLADSTYSSTEESQVLETVRRFIKGEFVDADYDKENGIYHIITVWDGSETLHIPSKIGRIDVYASDRSWRWYR